MKLKRIGKKNEKKKEKEGFQIFQKRTFQNNRKKILKKESSKKLSFFMKFTKKINF